MKMTPNCTGGTPKASAERNEEGRDYEDRGEDVHEAADYEEEEVQEEEEDEFRAHHRLDPGREGRGHVGVDEVEGESPARRR